MMDPYSIFDIKNFSEFEEKALAVFRHQAEHVQVYRDFVELMKVNPKNISDLYEIPFLPIRFFKQYSIIENKLLPEKIFTSSGTTGQNTSKHLVADLALYHHSLSKCFHHFYGDLSTYCIFALLPSYLERNGSSLIDMVEYWTQQADSSFGGFYLYNHDELHRDLLACENAGKNAILIGVSFALLDFVEKYPMQLSRTIVMETGGMKGRKKEITRQELHSILKKGFGTPHIHSEYGMTELLSQAYMREQALFETPNWMHLLIRETEDPLTFVEEGKTGGVNVIDLANFHSCSFIATDDLGRKKSSRTFEILGRFDHSDVRGCNLLVV
ncbi:Acyl-protein synthetase, LuxE [Weeksella virosa]|uniref:acyl transferase n=1 Tax=Weeksella virosa TaxID=1014 RepID=UPI000DFEB2B1|nr:acyl transferase [Weeksella virosa]SUP54606.1 Acyl-protein synthetase, LuxE [Weeksella virosa]